MYLFPIFLLLLISLTYSGYVHILNKSEFQMNTTLDVHFEAHFSLQQSRLEIRTQEQARRVEMEIKSQRAKDGFREE